MRDERDMGNKGRKGKLWQAWAIWGREGGDPTKLQLERTIRNNQKQYVAVSQRFVLQEIKRDKTRNLRKERWTNPGALSG